MKKKAKTKGMALVLALMMLITSLVWFPTDEAMFTLIHTVRL